MARRKLEWRKRVWWWLYHRGWPRRWDENVCRLEAPWTAALIYARWLIHELLTRRKRREWVAEICARLDNDQ